MDISNCLFHIIPCNGAWTTTLPFSEVFWSLLSKDIFLKAQRYMLRCALIPFYLNTTFVLLCFVGSRIFGLVSFKLANSPTNTIPRLELPKHGLQSFFEGDPYILEQNFPWQRWRALLIMLCACGPGSVAWNVLVAMNANGDANLDQCLPSRGTYCS